ncbi:amino acid permease-domain-containing protein [Choanephora cucurbitarum]|nr:amino acid permease-domain-containing protein [Choanephora cucurbitarum]
MFLDLLLSPASQQTNKRIRVSGHEGANQQLTTPLYSSNQQKCYSSIMTDNIEKIQTADQTAVESAESFTSVEYNDNNKNHSLQRNLKARHIQMIALGGTIGTGLFMSSGSAISSGGPGGALVAYGISGIIVYCVMMGLGEMSAYIPVAGSFSHFATRFADPSLGFMVGWIYWANWAIGVALELTGVGMIMEYWVKNVNTVVWSIVTLVILVAINVVSVKGYGEVEYWISLIKVLVVIVFIIVGLCVDTGLGGVYYGVSNFHLEGGAFPFGFLGVFNVFLSAAFAFNGVELFGITAGESANPHKTVPLAVKQIFFRIVLFYFLSILVIALVIPYTDPNLLNGTSDVAVSPFTLVFQKAGANWAADFMNAIILITMISAGNSGVYSSSRTLLALADDGYAPRFVKRVNRWGIPIWSVLATCLVGCIAFLTSFIGSGIVFTWLQDLTALAGLITWISISITHIRFRQGYVSQGRALTALPYVAPFFPYADIFVIVICTIVVFGQGYSVFIPPVTPSNFFGSYIGLILGILLYVGHRAWYRPAFVKNIDMDFESGTFHASVMDVREDENLDENGKPLSKWRVFRNRIISVVA